MGAASWNSPAHIRHLMSSGIAGAPYLRAALLSIPPHDREKWWDEVLSGGAATDVIPADGADLPRGCAPYLPCGIDALVAVLDAVRVNADDVFIDIGSGTGRSATLLHFLTGASAIGVEIQGHLVDQACRTSLDMKRERVVTVRGDAAHMIQYLPIGTVYFLYCPFSGERLDRVLGALEERALARTIHVCTVDMPPLEIPWLSVLPSTHPALHAYRSRRLS